MRNGVGEATGGTWPTYNGRGGRGGRIKEAGDDKGVEEEGMSQSVGRRGLREGAKVNGHSEEQWAKLERGERPSCLLIIFCYFAFWV